MSPRSPRLSAISLAGALLALVAACDRPSSAAPAAGAAPPPMPVGLTSLVTTEVRDTTEYIATLRSRRSIAIQPQVEGHVTRILVKSGDRVVAGQPLVQIDAARAEASVVAAEANRTSRQATLQLARTELARTAALVEKGALAGSSLDQARSAVEAAEADVAALGAQIRASQVQLRYFRLVAPAAGVVGDIPVRVGDLVSPATLITTLDNNDALEAYISIPVERIPRVRLGTEVQLIGDDGATAATGQVHFISPQVSTATQSVLIKAGFGNDAGALRAEQFVRARVVWSAEPGLIIPALSVVRLAGQAFVYAAEPGEGGKGLVARQKPVVLAGLSDDHFAVRSGLEAGDQIVTDGIQKLRDGAPIAPDQAAPPAADKPATDKPATDKPVGAKPAEQK